MKQIESTKAPINQGSMPVLNNVCVPSMDIEYESTNKLKTETIATRMGQLFQTWKYRQQTQKHRQLDKKPFTILYLDRLEKARAETQELDTIGNPTKQSLPI